MEITQLLPRNHVIILELNIKHVNVQPFWYPHIQKKKIKHLIWKMCIIDIIWHSNTYSSLLILIRKKDISWYFPMDHSTLIILTILDRFCIRIIETLLYALHNIFIFSKIDQGQGIIKFK